MTVKELIEQLKSCPEDLEVFRGGFYDRAVELVSVEERTGQNFVLIS